MHSSPTLPGQTVEIEVVCLAWGRRDSTWVCTAHNRDTGRQAGLLQHELSRVDQARLHSRLYGTAAVARAS